MPNPSRKIPAPFKRPVAVLAYDGEHMEDVRPLDRVQPAGWGDWWGYAKTITNPGDGKLCIEWDRRSPLTGTTVTYHLPRHRVKIDHERRFSGS